MFVRDRSGLMVDRRRLPDPPYLRLVSDRTARTLARVRRAEEIKRTCSPCLRGHHTLCTSPGSCAHARCDVTATDDTDGPEIA